MNDWNKDDVHKLPVPGYTYRFIEPFFLSTVESWYPDTKSKFGFRLNLTEHSEFEFDSVEECQTAAIKRLKELQKIIAETEIK